MIKGYWATHPYKRHSVGEMDGFIGWSKIREICDAGISRRDIALPAFMFSTGCRASEVNQLRPSHFDLTDPDYVQCVKIPIVKQKKIGVKQRTFSFPKKEPIYNYIESYLDYVKGLTSDRDVLLFGFSRNAIYKTVVKQGKAVGLDIWAHWFRGQRASQLGYEYSFTASELMEWFKVIDTTWANRYCKLGDRGFRKIMKARAPETYQM